MVGDWIADSLVSQGVGSNVEGTDWQVFVGYLQDAPDRAICVYETPGEAPLEAWAIDYPGFQVRVRGAPDGYAEAREKMHQIFLALHANETAIGSVFVYCYARNSSPTPLGNDTNRRPGMSMNFRTMKNREPS